MDSETTVPNEAHGNSEAYACSMTETKTGRSKASKTM